MLPKIEIPIVTFAPIGIHVEAASAAPVVYLHGRLRGRGVHRPAVRTAPLVSRIANGLMRPVLLPEYSPLYSLVSEEPQYLSMGPLSDALREAFETQLSPSPEIDVVAYSFGCILLAKLLRLTAIEDRIRSIVLLAPVIWRSCRESHADPLTDRSTLIMWGTHDNFATRNKPRDLVAWFPQAVFCPIEGGNHLYYLIPSPMDRFDENPATILRSEQQETAARQIVTFFSGIESTGRLGQTCHVTETSPDGTVSDLEVTIAKS